MTGLVGDGIAYLQMVRDGYRWVDHFENHAVRRGNERRSALPISYFVEATGRS